MTGKYITRPHVSRKRKMNKESGVMQTEIYSLLAVFAEAIAFANRLIRKSNIKSNNSLLTPRTMARQFVI